MSGTISEVCKLIGLIPNITEDNQVDEHEIVLAVYGYVFDKELKGLEKPKANEAITILCRKYKVYLDISDSLSVNTYQAFLDVCEKIIEGEGEL